MMQTVKFRMYPDKAQEGKLHDLFKHSGITSFKAAEILKKTILMKHVLNSVTSAQPDNLKAGLLSSHGKIDDYHKTWNYITNYTVL